MTSVMRPRAILIAFVVALTACGPRDAPSATGELGPSATADAGAGGGEPASPDPASTASVEPGPEGPSPFGRHDTAPGGVAEFLDFRGGGGGHCVADEPGAPSVRLEVFPLPLAVCAFGFAPGESIDLLLRGPDGSESTNRQLADGSGKAIWDLDDLPDRIQGDYSLQATQGERRAQGDMRVEFDSIRASVLPEDIRIGETIRLFVAGGAPMSSVPAFLYFAPQGGVPGPDGSPAYRFAADIGPIELDANGEGRMALATRAGDPPGSYSIVVDAPLTAVATPSSEPVPLGELDEYVNLGETAGLTCSGSVAVGCNGEVGGQRVVITMVALDGAAVDSVFAVAGAPSHETLAFFGRIAHIATGLDSAEIWVASLAEPAERRFGAVNVDLTEESDGSWQLFIDSGPAAADDGVRVDFEVHP
jgi:hypothetical protein